MFGIISKKIEEVDKASLLVNGILNGEEKFNFQPLKDLLSERRTTFLNEIRKELGIKSSTKKTVKRKSKDKDGISTYDTTLEMLNKGMSVEQIAKDRELTVGTIEGHLAKAVDEGRISIYKFMSEEVVAEISNAIAQLPKEFSSKDLYVALKGKFGYGQLRSVMAHVKNSKG